METLILLLLYCSVSFTRLSKIYLKSDYYGNDSDGSESRPFSNLQEAVKHISSLQSESQLVVLDDTLIINKQINFNFSLEIGGPKNNFSVMFEGSGCIDVGAGSNLTVSEANFYLQVQSDSYIYGLLKIKQNSLLVLRNWVITSKNSFLILAIDSGVFLIKVRMLNIDLRGSSILYFDQAEASKTYQNNLCFINCEFRWVFQDPYSNYPIILITNLIEDMTIANTTFFNISTYLGFLSARASNPIHLEFKDNCAYWIWTQFYIFEINQIFELTVSNNTFKEINFVTILNLTGGGVIFKIANCYKIGIGYLNITNAISAKTTVGMTILELSSFESIFKGLFQERVVSFENCLFKNISSSYITNHNSGGALLIVVDCPILMRNCSFEQIRINSTNSAKEKVGGPCLQSLSRTNELLITSCRLIDSHSRYSSNGIIFLGRILRINNSIFIDNFPIFDESTFTIYYQDFLNYLTIMELHMEIGGALFINAEESEIRNCIFSNNMGYLGGAIYFSSNSEQEKSRVLIGDCIFKNNSAGYLGGGIGFSSLFNRLDAIINNCSFISNTGYSGGGLGLAFTSNKCTLRVLSSYFTGNLANYGSGIDSNGRAGLIVLEGNLFYKNNAINPRGNAGAGSVLKLLGIWAVVLSNNNRYINNFGLARGTLIFFTGLFEDNGSLFHSNYGSDGASAYSLGGGIQKYSGTSFINERSMYSGALVEKEYSLLEMYNVTFEQCSSGDKGAIFVVSENSVLNISNCRFLNNYANSGSIIYAINNLNLTKLMFFNCYFFGNKVDTNGLFDISLSNLLISNSEFFNTTNAILSSFNSFIKLYKLVVKNLQCSNYLFGCLASIQSSSIIYMESLEIQDFVIKFVGLCLYIEDSALTFSNTSLSNITSPITDGSVIKFINSDLVITDSLFTAYSLNVIYSIKSNCFISKTIFSNKGLQPSLAELSVYLTRSPVIIIEDGINLIFQICYFEKNFAAPISFSSPEAKTQTTVIETCFFSFNIAAEGGALRLSDTILTIRNSVFLGNWATTGGAIFYYSKDSSSSQLFLSTNLFIGNFADLEGGAIKATNNIPSISENFFIFNTAIYGNDLALNPVRMKIVIRDKEGNEEIYDDELAFIKDVQSGTSIPLTIYFYLIDERKIIVGTVSGSSLKASFLSFDDVSQMKVDDWMRSPYDYLPEPTAFIRGRAEFSSFFVSAQLDSVIYLKFYTDAINNMNGNKIEETPSDKYLSGRYHKIIKLHIRNCKIGEIHLKEFNRCLECPNGEYSLGDPDISKCTTCPTGAECSGGANIITRKGFWRGLNSTTVHFCEHYFEHCIGGSGENCKVGSTGPICSVCDYKNNFFAAGHYYCEKCSSLPSNIVRIVLLFIFSLLLIWALVSIFHRQALNLECSITDPTFRKLSNRTTLARFVSIYLKIFINYNQFVSIINEIDIKWPYYVETYLTAKFSFGDLSMSIFSVDCLIREIFPNELPMYLRSRIAAFYLPVSIILIFFLYMAIRRAFKANSFKLNHFIICLIVVSAVLQISVLKDLVKLINCKEFEPGKMLVKANMLIDCDSEQHISFNRSFTYPALAYWISLYPITCFLYLMRNRSNINAVEIRMKMSYFLNGYKANLFYWEFFLMYRKILVILLTNFFTAIVIKKATIMIIICALTLLFTIQKKPYVVGNLNRLEVCSNFSSLVVVFSGVFYLLSDSEWQKALMFLIIISAEFYFYCNLVCYIISTLLFFQRGRIFKWFPRLFFIWLSLKKSFREVVGTGAKFMQKFNEGKKLFFKFYREYKTGAKRLIFKEKSFATYMYEIDAHSIINSGVNGLRKQRLKFLKQKSLIEGQIIFKCGDSKDSGVKGLRRQKLKFLKQRGELAVEGNYE